MFRKMSRPFVTISFTLLSIKVFAFKAEAIVAQQIDLPRKEVTSLQTIHVDELNNEFLNSGESFPIKQQNLAPAFAPSEEVFHERINQTYKGIEVYGAQLINHWQGWNLKSRSGRVAVIEEIGTTPSLDLASAKKRVMRKFPKIKSLSAKLNIFPSTQGARLIYLVKEEEGFDSAMVFFVDAHSGEIFDYYNSIAHGAGIGIDGVDKHVDTHQKDELFVLQTEDGKISTHSMENGANLYKLPGKIISSEDDTFDDPAAVDAHYYATKYIEFLKEVFNRDSYDDKGAKIVSSVHFKKDWVNAFWSPTSKQMVYGDGDGKKASPLSGAFDVIAHEISHAVTTYTSNLVYRNESGALNEAFSDIIATFAEYIVQPNKFDYLIGEDIWTPEIAGDALRYMDNPGKAAGNRDHYDSRYTGLKDNGGVHINSGIANLAFYLLAEGGSHPRLGGDPVSGIGIEKAGLLFWETFTTRLVKLSTFQDCRKEMIKVAKEKYDEQAAAMVAQAWNLVGVVDK